MLVACTNTVTLGWDDTHVYPDGATRVHCGAVDCEPGKYCCSEECGVCAAPGGCPPTPISCGDASTLCGPDDVALTGPNLCSQFVWNGVDCVESLGCTCSRDCTLPQPTYVACMELHSACWAHTCSTSVLCPAHYYCERATCDLAAHGACRAIPSDCSSATRTAVCGCDRIAYASSCEAARAVQSTSPDGPNCGVCNAPNVTLTPGCMTSLGWMWDGRACVEAIGCTCTGDCSRLEPSETSCLGRYQDACTPMFPCGSVSCRRDAEVCNVGPMGSYCSAPGLAACPAPTCACLVGAGLTTTANCTDDGAGRVVLTSP